MFSTAREGRGGERVPMWQETAELNIFSQEIESAVTFTVPTPTRM